MEAFEIDGEIIRKQILKMAATPSDARNIVQYLVSLDWNKVYKDREEHLDFVRKEVEEITANGGGFCDECHDLHKRLYYGSFQSEIYVDENFEGNYCYRCYNKLQMRYIKLHEWLTSCDECLDLFPNKERKELPKLVKYRGSWRSNCYCTTCYDKIVARYTTTCPICKEKKLEYKDGYCIECYKKESLNIQHVQIHLSRARKAGTEATLTFNQWKRAVEYFNYRCAYCVEYPYEVLEHYIPLTLGGGTTADNCVPACSSCNNRKGNVMPEIFARYFRQENLIRVRDFLELQREDNSDREESSTCSA